MSSAPAELRQPLRGLLPQLLTLLTACGATRGASAPGYVATSGGAAEAAAVAGSAVTPMPYDEPAALGEERPGLGTTWGEQVSAPISFAPFQRATAQPQALLALHYNDAEGVAAHALALGVVPAPVELMSDDHAVSVAVVDEAWRPLPGFTAAGRTLIMGEDGARYRIVVKNDTPARFEIVASVDGLDVIDGKPADPNRRGYLVDPYGLLTIEGFRTSDQAIAAFRFGAVEESYAAQTSGDRNVGVIGLAVFAERGARWTPAELRRRDTADPFPARGYATPPR
jgi:hypothetical protein